MSEEHNKFEAPGVFVLAIIFLVTFILIWLAHAKWLSDLWELY